MADTDDREERLPGDVRTILSEAREIGFLGPGPIEAQIHHADGFRALAQRLSPTAGDGPGALPRLLDLGSGGGLPGLVIAARWAGCRMVLLDAGERRAAFLHRAVVRSGLADRVTVVQARAEEFGREQAHRGAFDGVVARSFGPPAVVAECVAPLLRVGGWAVVSEPPAVEAEDEHHEQHRWPVDGLAALGLLPEEQVRGEFGYQILRQGSLCPERYPRRNGVPAKTPLF